jgi:REP element-mobilizing transposase RayT
VARFKNLAQRDAWRLGVQGAFWQPSFWNHFLRSDERIEAVVEYVLNNPVRSGLVAQWAGHRFSGSTVFESVNRGGGQAPALHPEIERGR